MDIGQSKYGKIGFQRVREKMMQNSSSFIFFHQQRKNFSSVLQSAVVYAIIKTGSNLPTRCVYVWYVFDQHLLYGNPCSVVGFDAAYA